MGAGAMDAGVSAAQAGGIQTPRLPALSKPRDSRKRRAIDSACVVTLAGTGA